MANKLTRECIVEAADRLFYEQGFEHTSFAQIAQAVGISRGNFYYHFKTKDDILDAVITHRLARTSSMLDNWEVQGDSPSDRIRSFIGILMMNRAKIKRYGCPVGTLCTELAKLNHPAKENANQLFSLFRVWLRRQFELLGREQDADALAMHLLAFSQGVATLANAFEDEGFVDSEVSSLNAWLDSVERQNNTQPEVL
jgi:TetR/AcrR family transcriptional regulator, transcriptional repressor for nem operon